MTITSERLAARQLQAEQSVTDEVLASFDGASSDRYRSIMQSLVRHLHDFARDVRLTEEEWTGAIHFLTRTGHITNDRRQEFILLSDVLGLSMLTVAINHPLQDGATESTVFGPFFAEGAPRIEQGGDMSGGAAGEPCWVEGRVVDPSGAAIPGARIDVWEADEEGRYDVQHDGGPVQGRAWLTSAEDGSFRFWGLTPTPYPIPYDGPVGDLLTAADRSPMRPSHLHFMVTADGYRRLVTHIFVRGDEYLDQDAVFGVKQSLIIDFDRHAASDPTPDGRSVETSWTRAGFDIVLPSETTAAPIPSARSQA